MINCIMVFPWRRLSGIQWLRGPLRWSHWYLSEMHYTFFATDWLSLNAGLTSLGSRDQLVHFSFCSHILATLLCTWCMTSACYSTFSSDLAAFTSLSLSISAHGSFSFLWTFITFSVTHLVLDNVRLEIHFTRSYFSSELFAIIRK